MVAVRREDIAMMRLLIAHGANPSDEILGVFDQFTELTRKTALLVAIHTKNEEVIRELVTAGADVNQLLGPSGTVLHVCHVDDKMVQLLAALGADPNVTNQFGDTPVSLVLERCHAHDVRKSASARESLHVLLPIARDLDTIVQTARLFGSCTANCYFGTSIAPIDNNNVWLFLQHGARIRYCELYLTGSSDWAEDLRENMRPHSERFIDLLRVADTDFSDTLERIASVDKDEWAPLNLAVLDQKLSQPLTLQVWCVISVRRQLRSVSALGLCPRIERLPLPKAMKDRLKLEKW